MTRSDERVDLAVRFEEKDQAKALGARWDSVRRTWYVPPGLDLELFEPWLPSSAAATVIAVAPVYLLTSQAECWRCGRDAVVATIALERFRDLLGEREAMDDSGGPFDFEGGGGWGAVPAEPVVTLSNVTALPPELLRTIRQAAPLYRQGHSKAGGTYYMNHCLCGAHFGDFFLHHEPGGAFFPVTADEAARLRFIRIDVPGEVAFAADLTWSSAVVEAHGTFLRGLQ